jgi:glycosyltransferase involved in cell wall biosynthesis
VDAAQGGPPRVSVIVRTRDRPRLLAEALESLRRQTMTDFETVLVNDGSAGGLERALLEPAPGRALRVVTPGPPGGRSRALNAGLAAARGRFVAYLDDDDLYLPEHLETLVRFLEGSDEYRAAYTSVEQIEQTLGGDGGYHDAGLRTTYGYAFDAGRLLSSNTIPIIALMHERALVDEVGSFDESFDLFEDWDFLIRLSAKHRFHHIAKVTAVYRVRDDGSNATSSAPWLSETSQQARRQLFAKHWPRRTVESEMALVDGWAREGWTLGQSLAAKDRDLAALRRQLADVEGRLKKAEAEILDFGADAARQTQASGEREAALAVECNHLRALVDQTMSSLAWRLFTPWWKLKGLLKK